MVCVTFLLLRSSQCQFLVSHFYPEHFLHLCAPLHTRLKAMKIVLYTHPYLMGRYKRAWMHFSHNQTLASKSQRCRRRQRQSWITFKVKWQVILFNSYLLCARQSDFRLVSLLSFETLMNLNRNCKEKKEEEEKLNAFMESLYELSGKFESQCCWLWQNKLKTLSHTNDNKFLEFR